MGDPRPCDGSREDAMAAVHDLLRVALDDLRAHATGAGADLAADVRCFGEPQRAWCEGVARVTGGAAVADVDPVAPTSTDPPIARSHFVLVADGSYAIQGKPTIGSSVGFRYQPVEVTFDVLSLPGTGLVGIGGTGLARIALGRSGFDAIAGGSAAAVAPNGAVNPRFALDATGFVGVGYQAKWRWMGAAQPWFQLRIGATRYEAQTTPLVALHIGLSTPDR